MDFTIHNHGSIILIHPNTNDAEDWLNEHIDPEATFWGGAVVVEPRYVEAILAGIEDAGLSVEA